MLNGRVSKKYKSGDSVILLTGSKEYRGKIFTIAKIKDEHLFLNGYKTTNRAQKITDKNTENYKVVNVPVHISNVIAATADGKHSRVGFQIVEGKKLRILKKTKTAY